MDCSTLKDFKLQKASNNQALVLFTGNQAYQAILARALNNHFVSRVFADRSGRFGWGAYVHNVDEESYQQIELLLQLFQQHIFIQDDLTETFALTFHQEMSHDGRLHRTKMGELVNQAKPYGRPLTKKYYSKADELASRFINFIQQHPTYKNADLVIPVPSHPDKNFDLPTEIAHHIATTCHIETGTGYIEKIKTTRPMKDCTTPQEKIDNVRNAFAIRHGVEVKDRSVLLVDDIYHTGFTINEVGTTLFKAQVKQVLGLVATKTVRDR
jgi:predicted amidophosphoribosyltransferase